MLAIRARVAASRSSDKFKLVREVKLDSGATSVICALYKLKDSRRVNSAKGDKSENRLAEKSSMTLMFDRSVDTALSIARLLSDVKYSKPASVVITGLQ